MTSPEQEAVTRQYQSSDNLNARIALHQRFSTNPGFIPWLFDQFDLPAQCRILEVGCGTGMLWQANSGRIPEGWRLVLSDASPGMVATARDTAGHLPQVEAITCVDAQAIPFAATSFDAVIANHMLYHVPVLEAALAEICRVLKPDGKLYASTIGQNHMREYFDALAPFAAKTALMDQDEIRARFSLENGHARLAPWFSDIQLHRYEDALQVSEVEPLVAYVQSAASGEEPVLSGERLEQFRAYIAEQIAAHGFFYITKDSGIFVAG